MIETRRTTTAEAKRVGDEHRKTLKKILRHPTSGNVEWRQVRALLESVGALTAEHDGKVKVTLGDSTETFYPPHSKDIDTETIVELRQLLTKAGVT